jgi:predicted GIY-YIG superfamily endonuclease
VSIESEDTGDKRTGLYRHFDTDGTLLYVGISNDPDQRYETHRTQAHWFKQINRVEVEWFATRKAAQKAELAAIKSERPLHNKKAHPAIEAEFTKMVCLRMRPDTVNALQALADAERRPLGQYLRLLFEKIAATD